MFEASAQIILVGIFDGQQQDEQYPGVIAHEKPSGSSSAASR